MYEILRLQATNIHNPQEYRDYRIDVKKRLNAPFQEVRYYKLFTADMSVHINLQCSVDAIDVIMKPLWFVLPEWPHLCQSEAGVEFRGAGGYDRQSVSGTKTGVSRARVQWNNKRVQKGHRQISKVIIMWQSTNVFFRINWTVAAARRAPALYCSVLHLVNHLASKCTKYSMY